MGMDRSGQTQEIWREYIQKDLGIGGEEEGKGGIQDERVGF